MTDSLKRLDRQYRRVLEEAKKLAKQPLVASS